MARTVGTARIKRTRTTMKPVAVEKKRVYQFGQLFTKKFGMRGLQIPVPQQLRIIEKYMQGISLRRIAEEEDRARQTVTKIVRAPEVEGCIEKLREEVIALGDEMVKSVRFAVRHELDGRLAYEMLKDIGVLQPRAQVQLNNQSQMTEEQSEKFWTEEWMRRLDLMAMEKSRVYGTMLPEHLEELKRESDRISNEVLEKEAAGITGKNEARN
jgi:hypothetical protein